MMYSTTLFQPHIHLVYITFKYLLNILMPVQYLNLCLSISYFCQQLNDAQIFIMVKTTNVKVVKKYFNYNPTLILFRTIH